MLVVPNELFSFHLSSRQTAPGSRARPRLSERAELRVLLGHRIHVLQRLFADRRVGARGGDRFDAERWTFQEKGALQTDSTRQKANEDLWFLVLSVDLEPHPTLLATRVQYSSVTENSRNMSANTLVRVKLSSTPALGWFDCPINQVRWERYTHDGDARLTNVATLESLSLPMGKHMTVRTICNYSQLARKRTG